MDNNFTTTGEERILYASLRSLDNGMSRAWYCASVEPNQERIAQKYLNMVGVPTFLPGYLVKQKPPKRRNIEFKLLFRGYIFFSITDPALWPSVRYTKGVSRVLLRGDKDTPWYQMPGSVASEDVEQLRTKALSYDEVRRNGGARQTMQYIDAGVFVKIKSGPLADEPFAQRALVHWSEGERAQLLLMMFNREVKCEFYHRDLEVVK